MVSRGPLSEDLCAKMALTHNFLDTYAEFVEKFLSRVYVPTGEAIGNMRCRTDLFSFIWHPSPLSPDPWDAVVQLKDSRMLGIDVLIFGNIFNCNPSILLDPEDTPTGNEAVIIHDEYQPNKSWDGQNPASKGKCAPK